MIKHNHLKCPLKDFLSVLIYFCVHSISTVKWPISLIYVICKYSWNILLRYDVHYKCTFNTVKCKTFSQGKLIQLTVNANMNPPQILGFFAD